MGNGDPVLYVTAKARAEPADAPVRRATTTRVCLRASDGVAELRAAAEARDGQRGLGATDAPEGAE